MEDISERCRKTFEDMAKNENLNAYSPSDFADRIARVLKFHSKKEPVLYDGTPIFTNLVHLNMVRRAIRRMMKVLWIDSVGLIALGRDERRELGSALHDLALLTGDLKQDATGKDNTEFSRQVLKEVGLELPENWAEIPNYPGRRIAKLWAELHYESDGTAHFICHTKDEDFKGTKEAFQKFIELIQEQIDSEQKCPFYKEKAV